MDIENLMVKKLSDSIFSTIMQDADNDAIYCEIRYERDRSSFAGMAFKLNENNVVTVRVCKEKIIQEVSKYEKVYMGCELDYLNSIKETFSEVERNYGIEILFLVYSDVQSSQMIFEDLMKNIDEAIDKIIKLL